MRSKERRGEAKKREEEERGEVKRGGERHSDI